METFSLVSPLSAESLFERPPEVTASLQSAEFLGPLQYRTWRKMTSIFQPGTRTHRLKPSHLSKHFLFQTKIFLQQSLQTSDIHLISRVGAVCLAPAPPAPSTKNIFVLCAVFSLVSTCSVWRRRSVTSAAPDLFLEKYVLDLRIAAWKYVLRMQVHAVQTLCW